MWPIIPTISNPASTVVIRQAFERFIAPKEEQQYWAYYDPRSVGCVLTVEPQTTFVRAEAVDPWLRFQSSVADWRAQRGEMSSITEAALCPAYQAIIGMGPTAVPFLLAQLESEGDEPDQWFWALKAITGANPVRDEDRGDFVAMAHAWLGWAKTQGYAW